MSKTIDKPVRLTAEQQTALAEHARSVSLAAGAGCGKTFVLTQRFLSYLDPRVLEPSAELHELVAITFTDAAAREMRERIRRRCYERFLDASDPVERQAWNRLIRSLDSARISTIHSFCANLLRSHAAEAEIDPRFVQLEAAASGLLRLQTVDDRLRQLLLAGDERVIRLATRFKLSHLRDNIVHLLGENLAPVADQWLDRTPKQLVDAWQAYYREVVTPAAAQAILDLEPVIALQAICRAAQVSKPQLEDHFAEILDTLAQLPSSKTPVALTDRLIALARVQGVCKANDWDDPQQFEQFKATAEAVRNQVKKSPLYYTIPNDQWLESATTGLELLEILADIAGHYRQAKQDRNVLDFDDLLYRAHRLLTDPRFSSIRQNLNRGTRLLLVDEFQDTDPQQVAIVKALCGDDWSERGLFVVGDFKQSIYRFRGAEPRVSNELRATLPETSRLSLTTNFRSTPAILDFVNGLFHGGLGEQYEPLQASREQLAPTPAVELLWALDDNEDAEDELTRRMGEKQHARVREARYLARRLAQLIDEGEPQVATTEEANELRPLRLGDIAILMRSLSDVAIYEAALREQGLDYYLAGGHAFYAQQEIYDVLHLLRAIASPADELSLAGVLRSPFFALQDETLFWLVQTQGSISAGLFAASPPQNLSEPERAKVVRAAEILQGLRARKDRLLVTELLNEALSQTGYDAMLLGEFLGQRKVANLQKLVDQAREIDRLSPGDLNAFITQLSEFVVRLPKEPLATTQSEGDVIRMMTIHHAKGLEFPLVVVPDLGRGGHGGDRWPVLHEQLGPLVAAKEKGGCVAWDLYRFVEKEQDREERKRLLYVACTRAADYLILSSGIADLEKPPSDWLKFLARRFDLQTGRCLGSLPDGYGDPQVRVTLAEPPATGKTVSGTKAINLQKLIEKTRKLAANGKGVVPDTVQAVPVDHGARRRFSFSRLSGAIVQASSRQTTADYADESPALDPRGFGTLLHAVFEQLDFKGKNDPLAICQHVAPMHIESDPQLAAAEAAKLVEAFLLSPRAAELAQARIVRRELEFVLPWPLNQQPFEGRYLQGFIDCLYQDAAGDWHLLDYKSNLVEAAGVPQAAHRYAMQMFVYSIACEQALGIRPVESVLHFLRPSIEFSFQWDAAECSRLAEQIERAMQQQLSPDIC